MKIASRITKYFLVMALLTSSSAQAFDFGFLFSWGPTIALNAFRHLPYTVVAGVWLYRNFFSLSNKIDVLSGDVQAFRSEVNERFDTLPEEMKNNFQPFFDEINEQLGNCATKEDLASLKSHFTNKLAKHQKTLQEIQGKQLQQDKVLEALKKLLQVHQENTNDRFDKLERQNAKNTSTIVTEIQKNRMSGINEEQAQFLKALLYTACAVNPQELVQNYVPLQVHEDGSQDLDHLTQKLKRKSKLAMLSILDGRYEKPVDTQWDLDSRTPSLTDLAIREKIKKFTLPNIKMNPKDFNPYLIADLELD